ncbi:SRPBCC domain-containing protein [Chitinophagaceae bacterium LB-8]|uniref:SRPBCC domain-containing protein n=1 Tax=Paraflavisolibacter caeni TaxID=2982496 RepID=A0A9X2XW20_9BACT|nr:SRPBCC domain-containing protein [Paraflavisolibacter caeni]MCU7549985.1 SRPBCC domain-containing protein [Paraflavisolibacter caeni]
METTKFSIQINAPKEKVWQTLWSDDTYRQWTVVFHEGSYAKTDWKEGSSVQFLTPEGDGMYSRISKLIPNTQMTFEHQGEVKGGVEQPQSSWAGAKESYYLSENNGVTELTVEMDTVEEFIQYFKDIFPKALQLIKSLSEAKSTANAG